MANETTSDRLPPHAELIATATAYWQSDILHAAAELGIADRIGDEERTAKELAADLRLDARALYRFLRTLAGMGLVTEVAQQTFALTALGQALRTDAPGSARACILTLSGRLARAGWDNLLYSLQTGKTGFEKAHGKPLFSHLAEHPAAASLFSETMVGFHGGEPPAVAEAYDFGDVASIVDVGGATGNMLVHILERHARPRGVLFDLPHVVADAPILIASHGMSDRITIESGNFFEAVPEGHDAYLLSHIIHDWSKEQCRTILTHCRRAIAPAGRLLIVEMVLPEGDAPHPGKLLDMMMLVGPGGQERTASEYAALLAPAGFEVTRVVATASAVSIVEAVPI